MGVEAPEVVLLVVVERSVIVSRVVPRNLPAVQLCHLLCNSLKLIINKLDIPVIHTRTRIHRHIRNRNRNCTLNRTRILSLKVRCSMVMVIPIRKDTVHRNKEAILLDLVLGFKVCTVKVVTVVISLDLAMRLLVQDKDICHFHRHHQRCLARTPPSKVMHINSNSSSSNSSNNK
jgi:hypothetical protein